jgi:hypothetical protein
MTIGRLLAEAKQKLVAVIAVKEQHQLPDRRSFPLSRRTYT